MKITRLPHNDKTNGWNLMLPARTAEAAVDGDVTADWIVVGAGYAGLAAAARLAENCPDERIALVEAGAVGENASGRNSGFGIDLPHTVSSNLEQLEGAHRYMRLARGALAYLKDRMDTAEFDCDWSVAGKYQAAVTARGSRDLLEPFAGELDQLGEPYRWVEKDELVEKIGSTHFHRAIRTEGCVLLNPAALVRGLAGSLPDNVTLNENSPITEVGYQNGVQVTVPGGSVRAPKMILAANGFSERFGFLTGKFVHLAAHASITRPLTEDEQATYGVTEPWGLIPANSVVGITMRYTPDRRILIREKIDYCPKQDVTRTEQAALKQRHKRLFDARFPMLPDVQLEHTWTGYLNLSRNGAPAFGQIANNVWAAACQNGIGITIGTINGLLAADLASGRDNPLIADMQSLGTPDDLPSPPVMAVGARAMIAWEKWRNRHEA